MGAVSRRKFLKLVAVSAAGAVAYSGCTPFPTRNEFLAQSPAFIPEDLVSGMDNWYATVCRECRAGCGTIVRVYSGRALKVEGNPEYPVNRGATCARAQAAVQALYHPDRLSGPSRRLGERGAGRFQSLSWDQARGELIPRLQEAAGKGSLMIVTEPLSGHRAMVLDRFASALGGQRMTFEPQPRTVLSAAIQRVFGQDRLPFFDIARSQFVLSFGSNILGTWLAPVSYSMAYGEFRQGRPDRGYLVQVEPRLSQTGASADEWVPIKPGTEGVLALSVAQVVVSQGLVPPQAAEAVLGAAGSAALDPYTPQRAADVTGVSPERIVDLARKFAAQRPALAVGGESAAAHTNGLFNLTAIYALNLLAGSAGRPGGVIFNPPSPFTDLPDDRGATFVEWQRLAERLQSGQPPVNVLLLHNANPAYGLPQSLGIADALRKIPYIVSFSSFPDETTDLADLILPDHVALEAWGDEVPNPMPGVATVGLQQPLVKPFLDTRDFVDVLLSLAPDLGSDVQRAMPWSTYKDVLRGAAQQLQGLRRGSVTASDFEQFWVTLLQKGGWWDTSPAIALAAAPPRAFTLPTQTAQPNFAGSAQDYRFNLVVYPHPTLGEGGGAHLPWMQATPEPMTSIAWESWIEVNPSTAKELGLGMGDVVAVEGPNGSLEVPVYPYPAIPPDVVAMPLGQGHKSFGLYAEGRGVNAMNILAPLADGETGSLAMDATRVRLRRTGRQVTIPRYEGWAPTTELEHQPVVQVTRQ